MITTIEVAGEATYPADGGKLAELRAINYLFGHNGSGKTTISRAIEDPQICAGYKLAWRDGRAMKTLVYNRDFVELNFGDQLKGIFTLGADSTKAVGEVERLQTNIEKLDLAIDGLQRNLTGGDGAKGRYAELANSRDALEDACWESQKTHKEYFQNGFTPNRGNKAAFCDKLLHELDSNAAELAELDDLKVEAATVFQAATPPEPAIASISFDGFASIEADPILSRRVVGRDDVVIAGLIARLGNSDWVKQGVGYLEVSDGVCPFCQQSAPADLLAHLNRFFDEQYEADLAKIDALADRYEAATKNVAGRIDALLASPSSFLDVKTLTEKYALFKTTAQLNYDRLKAKRREPSSAVTLERTKEAVAAMDTVLRHSNEAIAHYNVTISDIATSKQTLAIKIWRFVVEERRTDLTTYSTTTVNIQRSIEGLETKLTEKKRERTELQNQQREIEASARSVLPTVAEINRVLSSFGFTGFKLSVAGERRDMYQIVRADGSGAAKTLSEGERSFITFLYFYHLLVGSTSGTDMMTEKVVVFDDPVSSLDAEVLFIVSALIRKVVSDMRTGQGKVRQIFVLTHNIYFHKEVSYDRDRKRDICRKDETFWVVRKRDNVSAAHRYAFNPIKTSYDLLWEEARNPERATLTIQNTLRRIVENYLVVLGGWRQDSIVALFEGRDQQICASLFSWFNDGSHGAHDELYLAADEAAVEGYLRVFAMVFDKTGHIEHYKMMMHRTENANEGALVAAASIPPAAPQSTGDTSSASG